MKAADAGARWPLVRAIIAAILAAAAWVSLNVYSRVIQGLGIGDAYARLTPFTWFTGVCLLVSVALLVQSLRETGLRKSRFLIAMALLTAIPFVLNLVHLIWWPAQTLTQ